MTTLDTTKPVSTRDGRQAVIYKIDDNSIDGAIKIQGLWRSFNWSKEGQFHSYGESLADLMNIPEQSPAIDSLEVKTDPIKDSVKVTRYLLIQKQADGYSIPFTGVSEKETPIAEMEADQIQVKIEFDKF